MIGLARSSAAKRFMQGNRAASSLAKRYVAGATAAEAVSRAEQLLKEKNLRSSLYYLGEYVDRTELVAENVAQKLAVIEALRPTNLDVHVSVDPTQIGQSLDAALARSNAFRIAEAIVAAGGAGSRADLPWMMLDMEDASVVDATIHLHDELGRENLPVGLTLQAYLKRTAADLEPQIEAGSRVRLVKGAFVGDLATAYVGEHDIKQSYRRLLEAMFAVRARQTGFYPVVATHDERLHDFALALARRNGWRPGEYEFEMLLGVRTDVAEALAARGERVRLYVPFGIDWWPYAVRRVGESPRNAWLLARSLLH